MYYGLDKEFEYTNLADAALAREQDLFFYELNINNYKFALEHLKEIEWTEDLMQYKHLDYTSLPLDLIKTVGLLQYKDHLVHLILTNEIEKQKCLLIYQALVDQIPKDLREQYIKEAYLRQQKQVVSTTKT
jgi:hypothetical protein